jgi:rhodanese-related sulfurtransferase
MKSKSAFHGVLAIIVLGTILGLGYNLFNPNKLDWVTKKRGGISLDRAAEAGTPKPLPRPEPGEAAAPPPGLAADPPGEAATGSPEELYADIPSSEFPIEVTLDEGKAFWDRGGLLVLDAREADEYGEGHIQGAELAPMDLVVGDLEWLDRMAAEPRPIMVYCGGGDCELSLDLAFAINETGHRRVMVLTDGYPAWEEAGYPVVKGDDR